MPKTVLGGKAAKRSTRGPGSRFVVDDQTPAGKASPSHLDCRLLDAALILEPELRTLHGVLVALRHLGERAEPIDPPAIAVLAVVGENALQRIRTIRIEMENGRLPDPDAPNLALPGA